MFELIMSEAYIVIPEAYPPIPLGLVLQQASLISAAQLEIALKVQDQKKYPNLKIGQILALQSFIKQETADFFVEDWFRLLQKKPRQPIGYYLNQAALLEQEQIERVLAEQKITGLRFGETAVLQGNLKQTTVEFFLVHLFPQSKKKTPIAQTQESAKILIQQTPQQIANKDLRNGEKRRATIYEEDVTWIN